MGDNLQAHITYVTAEAKLSRRSSRAVIHEVFHIPLALGTIQNRLEDTAEILKPICDELENELAKQPAINIDETGYCHHKKLIWLWAFVSETFAFFTLQASRGSSVVMRKQIGGVFRIWHAHKQGKISRAQLIEAPEPLIAKMRAFVEKNRHFTQNPHRTGLR